MVKNTKYLQVQKKILDYITSNRMQHGSLLPTEKRFAEIFNVSVFTVRRSLANLAENKLVDRRHGQGTFVGARLDLFEPHGSVTFLGLNDNNSTDKGLEDTLDKESRLGSTFIKYGYNLRIILRNNSNPSVDDAEKLKDSDGIIVSGYLVDEWLNLLKGLNKPLIILGNTNYKKLPVASVEYDWRALTVKLGRYWLKNNSKNIGLITPGCNYAPSLAIREGFRYLSNNYGGGYDPSNVLFTENAMIRREIWDFLDNRPDIDTILVEHGLYTATLEYLWQHRRDIRIGVMIANRFSDISPPNVIVGNFSEDIWMRTAEAMVKQIAVGLIPINSIKIAPADKEYDFRGN